MGVMAHIDRRQEAEALAASVDAEVLSWDDGSLGENANGDCAWRQLADRDTDWSIVLQDDALPIPGFRRHARAALRAAPPTAVSFYVGTGQPRVPFVLAAIEDADQIHARWLEANALLWGVGVAMPTEQISRFLEWASRAQVPYDTRIGRWFERQGRLIRYTWPSLVDHADGPSILDRSGRRSPRQVQRVAHRIGVAYPDWSGPAVLIADIGARQRSRPGG